MCSREKRRNFYLENKGTKKVVICIVSSSWIVAGDVFQCQKFILKSEHVPALFLLKKL